MIIGTRRKDPMHKGDVRTAICGFPQNTSDCLLAVAQPDISGSIQCVFPFRIYDPIRTADHSLN
jgi:hypothetical protein